MKQRRRLPSAYRDTILLSAGLPVTGELHHSSLGNNLIETHSSKDSQLGVKDSGTVHRRENKIDEDEIGVNRALNWVRFTV